MTDSEPPTDEPNAESLPDEVAAEAAPDEVQTDNTAAGEESTPDGNATDDREGGRLRGYLDRALLVAFLLLAVVAALQFYFQAGAAIEVWITDPYEPLAKAAFNLAVLLLAAAGLSYQLRRVDSIAPGGGSERPADDR